MATRFPLPRLQRIKLYKICKLVTFLVSFKVIRSRKPVMLKSFYFRLIKQQSVLINLKIQINEVKQRAIDDYFANLPFSKKFNLFRRKNVGLLVRLFFLILLGVCCFLGLYSAMFWYFRPPFVYIYLNTVFGAYDLSKKAFKRKRHIKEPILRKGSKKKKKPSGDHFYDKYFL